MAGLRGIAGRGSITQSRGWLAGWPPVEAPGHISGIQPPFSDAVVKIFWF